MALPREDGFALILLNIVENAAMEKKNKRPTERPIFQVSISTIPARKLQEMKLAARQAGQGRDKAQKVFLDISWQWLFHLLAVMIPRATKSRATRRCTAIPVFRAKDNVFSGSNSMAIPMKREITRYPAAIDSISRRLMLARPQPRLTLKENTRIPITTPDTVSQVRSNLDT